MGTTLGTQTIRTDDDAQTLLHGALERVRAIRALEATPHVGSDCRLCEGKGFTVTERILAPKMIQRMQRKCLTCRDRFQEPSDSRGKLVLDMSAWNRTHSAKEVALLSLVFDKCLDAAEMAELSELMAAMKLK
jgi:hypothetical protein